MWRFYDRVGAEKVVLGPIPGVGVEVAYAEFTSNVPISATAESSANTIVTANAFTADGSSQYVVDFFAPAIGNPASAGGYTNIVLFLDGVSQGTFGTIQNFATTDIRIPVRLSRKLTPAAGSRTYSVRAYVGTGSATAYASTGGAGNNVPGFIRVTKIPTGSDAAAVAIPAATLVTSLPASPVDGQECYLTDSLTAGTYQWHLRYVAARASNKWVFIGGSPGEAEVSTGETVSTTSYSAAATPGPSFALPVAGDYIVAIGFTGTSSGGTSQTVNMSYDIGATPASDNDRVTNQIRSDSSLDSVSRVMKKTGLTAVTLTSKYKTSANSPQVGNRWIQVTPIALGG